MKQLTKDKQWKGHAVKENHVFDSI